VSRDWTELTIQRPLKIQCRLLSSAAAPNRGILPETFDARPHDRAPDAARTCNLDDRTLARWFDPNAFLAAPNFTYGNAGLRILSPDILRTVDFSLFKQFQIAEHSKLQFRWEAFNLPNTASFSAPNSTLDTTTVGRITSTSTAPRQMQVALKLTF